MVQDSGRVIPQKFMEGFNYDLGVDGLLKKANTFVTFPSTAVEEKDIVSDSVSFYRYVTAARKVKVGSEITLPRDNGDSSSEVKVSVLGSVTLRGHQCKIIQYESFFNSVKFSAPEVVFAGRSHCWGDIWVDKSSNSIVKATLKEDLLGELTLGDSKTPITMNILRKGILELK